MSSEEIWSRNNNVARTCEYISTKKEKRKQHKKTILRHGIKFCEKKENIFVYSYICIALEVSVLNVFSFHLTLNLISIGLIWRWKLQIATAYFFQCLTQFKTSCHCIVPFFVCYKHRPELIQQYRKRSLKRYLVVEWDHKSCFVL